MTLEPTEPEIHPTPARHRGPSLGIRFAIAFLLGIVLVAGAGGGALYAYGRQYTGRVLPGVQVGSVDLSGLTPEAARQALADAYGSLGAGQILLRGPDGDITIGYGEIGRRPDVDAMLDAALAAGRRGDPVADLIGAPQAAIHGVELEPVVTYDPERLSAALASAGETVERAPVDATLVAGKHGQAAVTRSVDGRVMDAAALAQSLAAQLGRIDAPDEIRADLPMTSVPAAIETADAEAALEAGDRMARDLTLSRGKDRWTIKAAQLRRLISYSPTVDGSIVPIVDVAGLDPLIRTIAGDVDQQAANAGFRYVGGRIVVGAKAQEGRRLDAEATRNLVIDALMARQGGDVMTSLEPVVAVRQPKVTTAEAREIAPRMQPLPKGRWTTWFHIYVNNGFGANIWIPATLINGYVVGPGETFDFWKAVGPVTRGKGFRQGGAIINGRTEPQGALAGGICSCSTTLFNAALRAGYDMGARRNHYYYIDRYPLGLDATVFISAGGSKQTMSWKNDTPYPVLIRGINTRANGLGYVTFQLYSVPTKRRVVIGAPTVRNVRQASDSVQHTSALPAGTSQRVEYPVDGKDVWRTVTVYERGKVLRRTTYYSHYSVITGVVLVGTGGRGNGSRSQ
jgi:vancomycin resistance protein YoaR